MSTHTHWQDDPDRDQLDGEPTNSPEDYTTFRLTQLAILLDEITPADTKGIDLERIAYYDFFAANPFAIFQDRDASERARLHRAAFDERQLSYASTGSRFANRRRRLQHDFGLLIAYGLAAPRGGGYGIAERGTTFVEGLSALYADQYRESVRVVHARLKRLSDTQLANAARQWLQTPSLLLDLYGNSDRSIPDHDSQSSRTPNQYPAGADHDN